MARSDYRDPMEQRREAILDAAERIFAEKGYHAAGIADIAQVLGMGHGTFYRYFRNKHDIALHILERGVELVSAIGLSEDPEASNTLEEYRGQVDRLLTGWLELAQSHPNLVRFLHEQAQSVDIGRLSQMMEAYVEYTQRFLRNGTSKSFLREDLDIDLTAQMLVALLFEGSRRALSDPHRDLRVRWKQAGMALMFNGIRR